MSFLENLQKQQAQARAKRVVLGVDRAAGADQTVVQCVSKAGKVLSTVALPEGFTPVVSSNIAGISFKASTNQTPGFKAHETVGHIHILFHNGTLWSYGYLRLQDFDDLAAGKHFNPPSPGKHFHKFIKARVAKNALSAKQLPT